MSNTVTLGRRMRGAALTCCALLALAQSAPAAAAEPNGRGTYQDLIALYAKLQGWQARSANPLATNYSSAAVDQRFAELTAMQRQLDDMAVARWPKEQKVDWLAVRARMDESEFVYRVTKPWARDPGFYVGEMQRAAFTKLPVKGPALEALRAQLRAVPKALAQARATLTDVAADHADLALFSLTNSDGVEDGYPYREKPPAGVIGWYRDLLSRAESQQPELKPDLTKAIGELGSFRTWLIANRRRMNGRAGVGGAHLDWYLRNVLLMPYTSAQVETVAQRELDRFVGFEALERFRNRGLPEIGLAKTREDYLRRLADSDARIRRFMTEKEFMTIPTIIPADWRLHVVPPNYPEPFNVPFIERATPPNFWEQVQFRDPSPDHLHAVIPGHRFDARLAKDNPDPIRSNINDGARWQGWAVYLEESALQAGLFDDQPRVRELIYIFGLWRAARTIGDVWNQRNEMTAAEVADYWMKVTPLLDTNVARKYAHIRTVPGHGLEYTMGNIQMWNLLAERKRQLGDRFVLRDFHDAFIAKGRIPISLIRYEMTGYDKDVKAFFNRVPLAARR